MRTRSALVLLFGLILLMPSQSMYAGSWRHDVTDEQHQELAKQKQFDSVCLILKDSRPNISGVLIHSRWVLTAGHEVTGKLGKNRQVVIGEKTYDVKRIVMHPQYSGRGLGHGVDLALLELAERCKDVAPARFFRGKELGQQGYMVGFGYSGTGREFLTKPGPVGTKRAGVNVIDSIGGTINDKKIPDNLLVSDFDHPDKPELNVIGDETPLDLEYCPAGGDNGGGLFIKVGGKWLLAGIFSTTTININDDMNDGIHGSVSYWTRLSPEQKWIRKAMRTK